MRVRHDPKKHGGFTAREIEAGNTHLSQIPAWMVQTWVQRVLNMGVLEPLAHWRGEQRATRSAGGDAKPYLTDLVILVALFVLAAEGRPLLITEVARLLEYRLDRAGRRLLGIDHLFPEEWPDDPTDPAHGNAVVQLLVGAADNPLRGEHDWYFLAYRAFHRPIAPFDGWVAPRKLELLDEPIRPRQLKMLDERLAIEAWQQEHAHWVAETRRRAVWFINKFLEMTFSQSPQFSRRDHLALALDQTAIRATSQRRRWRRTKGVERPRWNRYTGEQIPRPVLEMDADPYPKTRGDHRRDPDSSAADRPETELSFIVDVLVDVAEDPTAPRWLQQPQTARALLVDTPNKRIGEHAVMLTGLVQARAQSIERLTVDRGYNYLDPDTFHRKMAAANIPLVMDYRDQQKGIASLRTPETRKTTRRNGISNGDAEAIAIRNDQEIALRSGALFVEGRPHCPAMALRLIDASTMYDKGEISLEQYQEVLAERHLLELHVHERSADGTVKYRCPAFGRSATAKCPRRYNNGLHPKAVIGKHRAKVFKQDLNFPVYKVCSQTSITIGPDVDIRQRQLYQYGTTVWHKTYHVDRQSDESFNNYLKKHHHIDDPSRRLIRGIAAQQLFIGIIAAVANMNRMLKWLHDLERWRAKTGTRQLKPPPGTENPHKPKLPRRRDRLGLSRYGSHPPPLEAMDTPPPWGSSQE